MNGLNPTDVVLITGANGFVGSALTRRLAGASSYSVRACVRRADWRPPAGVQSVLAGDLASNFDWSAALRGVGVVVHTAARVHVMNDRASDPLEEFRRSNVEGTLNLARQASRAGVRRFVFISSIKVNGESTTPGNPFRAADIPGPLDPYGVSKLEAEQKLAAVAGETGIELSIIRPPLVYGPGVGANFRRMMRWVHSGLPLPLGAIANRRSLIGIDNLVDLIRLCLNHPAAAGATLLASDDEDVSTPALLRLLGQALRRPARLLPVPVALLKMAGLATGQTAAVARLCESLEVDISSTRQLLGWAPPVALSEGLTRAAAEFHDETRV